MIKIQVNDEMFAYDMYHITKAFCPGVEIEQKVDRESTQAVTIIMTENDKFIQSSTCVNEYDTQAFTQRTLQINAAELSGALDRKLRKRYVNLKVYAWLSEVTGKELAWGIMTGVRPTKPMMNLIESGMTDEEVINWMQKNYHVTDEKAQLGLKVAKKEKALLEQLDYKDGYSLYVGIPFCPTTCSYCSFTSYPIAEWKQRVDEYLDAVCKELTFIAEKSQNKKLNTIYIGGGTPTTLEPEQLDRLLTHLEKHFSYADLKEITVEAGRPDSITREKLEVLKAHNIGRISINPQTMQQKTLDIIGRKHTVEDIRRVYGIARELGFDNINMDLIAGLPGETVEDMRDTLEQIKEMAPDSLTVHALAMKRASRMTQEQKRKVQEAGVGPISQTEDARTEQTNQAKAIDKDGKSIEAETATTLSQMIELASNYAKQMDLEPYYLYRQKNIAGNFENVGYAKVDKAGIYNILIMEEKQSIIAVGAGASTKVVIPDDKVIIDLKTGNPKKIVRTENVRDIQQYICRIDEMIERKGELLWH
ncbi:MAG: coproporphyrinogen dehydrogenase HemZ [Faecalimonas sp.]|nr:coproporphyrinogen dehydrogenase HemZ [Faecalimonas sp.]